MEWGCGGGWNLKPFKDDCWNVYGVDPDKKYVDYGRKEFGVEIISLSEYNSSFKNSIGRFDLIVLNHVLEHIANPFKLLESLDLHLKETGLLYISMPFLENIRNWGYSRFFHIAHFHYPSIIQFQDDLIARGYSIVNRNDEVGYIIARKSSRPIPPKTNRKNYFVANLKILILANLDEKILRIGRGIGIKYPSLKVLLRPGYRIYNRLKKSGL
ncbi:class I SAM-dependent methyltransferase [Pseudobacteriovorax antillogorgiicola]|uniref:class I SAM-dependent methyltransferase n=1 Tax=Pseudobacteriovorax antillogorgiicola TaxID=1513793 RepID=UPI0014043898